MTGATIHVKHNGIGMIEGAWIIGPAIGVNDRCYACYPIEAFFQEQASRVEFVFSRSVTSLSRDQNNAF